MRHLIKERAVAADGMHQQVEMRLQGACMLIRRAREPRGQQANGRVRCQRRRGVLCFGSRPPREQPQRTYAEHGPFLSGSVRQRRPHAGPHGPTTVGGHRTGWLVGARTTRPWQKAQSIASATSAARCSADSASGVVIASTSPLAAAAGASVSSALVVTFSLSQVRSFSGTDSQLSSASLSQLSLFSLSVTAQLFSLCHSSANLSLSQLSSSLSVTAQLISLCHSSALLSLSQLS